MNYKERKARAAGLRWELENPPEGVIMSPMLLDKIKRMIWDLERPPFSNLRQTLYAEARRWFRPSFSSGAYKF